MPYRPTFGLYANSPFPTLAAIPAASLAGGCVATGLGAFYFLLVYLVPEIPNLRVRDILGGFLVIGLAGLFVLAGASVFVGFHVMIVGLPIAWLMRRHTRHPAGAVLAIAAAVASTV